MPKSTRGDLSFQARIAIDSRLKELQLGQQVFSQPRKGWIYAIRTALGMTGADLSRRLNIAPSGVTRIEKNEAEGTINIETLKRVAEALDCDFVYGFVPRRSLELTVRERARKISHRRLALTQQTMSLERQTIRTDLLHKLAERNADELIRSSRLWRKDSDEDQ
jgi:predicted DNA-binding mobile mystery protein A